MLTRLKAQLFLQVLRDADRLPSLRLIQYAGGLLQQLIGQAVTSPFWRERLAMLIGADGAVSLDRWQDVPPLSPEQADRIGTALLAVDMGTDSAPLDVGASAGPFRLRNALPVLADQCVFERALELHRVPLDCGLIDILDQPFLTTEDWSWNTTFEKAPYREIPFAWPPEMQWQAVRTNLGAILRASPFALTRLVDFLADTREDFAKLPVAVSVGAPIADSLRERLLDRVAQSVIAIWHDPRLGIIAYSDPRGVDWRVAGETQFVEVIGADGRRCPAFEPGRVAVTPLYLNGTPAIRFLPGCRARSFIAGDGRLRLTELAVAP